MFIDYLISQDNIKDIKRNKKVRAPLIEKYIPKDGIGAELGVLFGNFSRVLLESSRAKRLHLIDPWYFLCPRWEWAGGNDSTVDALRRVLKMYKTEIEEGKMIVHVDFDIPVINSFPDFYFDWVYIDSSHEYEHTKKELNLLLSKIRPGGIVCGDDWHIDQNHRHYGVTKAVNEVIAENGLKLLYCSESDHQWFVQL